MTTIAILVSVISATYYLIISYTRSPHNNGPLTNSRHISKSNTK